MKVLSKKIQTKDEGIFYKEVIDEKRKIIDKVFIIRFREEGKDRLKTIGKYSQGIRQSYCKEKRNELLNKIRLGEEIPNKYKKQNIRTIGDLSKVYFYDKDIENKTNKKLEGKYTFFKINIYCYTLDKI
jgi:lipopolysaccharide export LptBFGC system permease protein LptF